MKKERNIIDYIKEFKDNSFDSQHFNDLDSLIFASLSYVNFASILKNCANDSMSIREAGEIFFAKHTKKDLKSNVFSVQTGIKILKSIYKTKRYSSIILRDYVKVIDNTKQFQAIIIDITDDLSYISFEGTDDLISGWYEDAAMSYSFPVPSQSEAINYINNHISPFSKKKYILGGHSKGGNLALSAGMFAKKFIKKKIDAIYMFDSPGVREKEYNSRHFKAIEPKIKGIITNYSIVGLLFKNTKNQIVVKSLKKGVMAHNLINWCINEESFLYANLSASSKKFKEGIDEWLECYSDFEKKEFISDLFLIFERAGINSLLDIRKRRIKTLHTLIKESKKLDKKNKVIAGSFIKFLVTFIKDESIPLVSEKLPRIKH